MVKNKFIGEGSHVNLAPTLGEVDRLRLGTGLGRKGFLLSTALALTLSLPVSKDGPEREETG